MSENFYRTIAKVLVCVAVGGVIGIFFLIAWV